MLMSNMLCFDLFILLEMKVWLWLVLWMCRLLCKQVFLIISGIWKETFSLLCPRSLLTWNNWLCCMYFLNVKNVNCVKLKWIQLISFLKIALFLWLGKNPKALFQCQEFQEYSASVVFVRVCNLICCVFTCVFPVETSVTTASMFSLLSPSTTWPSSQLCKLNHWYTYVCRCIVLPWLKIWKSLSLFCVSLQYFELQSDSMCAGSCVWWLAFSPPAVRPFLFLPDDATATSYTILHKTACS